MGETWWCTVPGTVPGTSDPGVVPVTGCSFAGDIGSGCRTVGDSLAAGKCRGFQDQEDSFGQEGSWVLLQRYPLGGR